MGKPMEVATITNPSGIDMEMYLLVISGFFLVNITHVRFLSLSVRNGMDTSAITTECYSMKLDLLTNATVVDDAIRFVYQKSNEKLKSSTNSKQSDKEESNEPDYNEDEDQLEEETEEESGQVAITTNTVF
jgi:hypothetical protein